jgi:hypothetical protein
VFLKGVDAERNGRRQTYEIWLSIYGGIVLKCNENSELLNLFLSPSEVPCSKCDDKYKTVPAYHKTSWRKGKMEDDLINFQKMMEDNL